MWQRVRGLLQGGKSFEWLAGLGVLPEKGCLLQGGKSFEWLAGLGVLPEKGCLLQGGKSFEWLAGLGVLPEKGWMSWKRFEKGVVHEQGLRFGH